MPEGPSILILREALEKFEGRRVMDVTGNTKTDFERIRSKKLDLVLNWGKHLLLCFDDFYVRIHFLMFGTYRIDERKDAVPRLSLRFSNGEVNFYTCSVLINEGSPLGHYDWEADVLAEVWNPLAAMEKLKLQSRSTLICDALLNQEIFSGVGNIIKNEVLWRTRVHPASILGKLPVKKLKEIITDAREYSFLFYEWKKIFQLKKNWQIYKKSECPRCHFKTIRTYLGRIPRLTCYCSGCQELYR